MALSPGFSQQLAIARPRCSGEPDFNDWLNHVHALAPAWRWRGSRPTSREHLCRQLLERFPRSRPALRADRDRRDSPLHPYRRELVFGLVSQEPAANTLTA